MWTVIAFVVVALAVVLGVGLVIRRRGRSRGAFADMSREDQVATTENLRGDAARRGSHDATKSEGTASHMRNNWGGTP